jgi:hypothetical protein
LIPTEKSSVEVLLLPTPSWREMAKDICAGKTAARMNKHLTIIIKRMARREKKTIKKERKKNVTSNT